MSVGKDCTILTQEEYDELSQHTYPFENLVFNGGGGKCIADIGTLKVFEDLGIRRNIKRYAGNSGGALTAAFAAIGLPACEIREKLASVNMKKLVTGSTYLPWPFHPTYLWNLWRHYGLETATDLEKWMGQQIDEKTGKPNITFGELYDDGKGVELAITATDVARKSYVFFHHKTHKNMPIIKAMRMSMSIPVIFTPEKMEHDPIGLFVDGGLLCNYPIMCYDGWYLSNEPDNGILRRYPEDHKNLDNMRDRRFWGYNKKTVGVMVYSATEQDIVTAELAQMGHAKAVKRPDTKLAKERGANVDEINKCVAERIQMTNSMDRLIRKSRPDLFDVGGHVRQASITLTDFTKADLPADKKILAILLLLTLKEANVETFPVFTPESINDLFPKYEGEISQIKSDIQMIFGSYGTPVEIFHKLKIAEKDSITFVRIQGVAESTASNLLESLRDVLSPSEKITHHSQYIFKVMGTPTFHLDRGELTGEDRMRTIGINTNYIEALDFDMEDGDRDYLIQCGKEATIAYLRWYIHHPQGAK